jgi:cytochrome bd-type quinol oxidase subunit 2
MKKLRTIFISLIASLMPIAAKAQVLDPGQLPSSVSSGPTLPELINNVVGILFFVVGVASVIVLIVAGIMFVVSAGNEKQTKQARDAILYAVIGLIVSAAAFAITSFINTQLGT